MFEDDKTPHVFATPPGVDFVEALAQGLLARMGAMPPHEQAQIQVLVNTTRMQRRLKAVLSDGPARILPRIRLITDLASDPLLGTGPPPVPPLQRRLEIAQIVEKLLSQEPDLAPRAALYPLSDSLTRLMTEMQDEGVDPSVFGTLDVSDQSGHWDRALRFLQITAPFFGDQDTSPDAEARQRRTILTLIENWTITPPDAPILIAGSTGSRGTTAALMQAVARLKNGAVLLPGFDFDLPQPVWDGLTQHPDLGQDHPQYRFAALMKALGLTANDVQSWPSTITSGSPRNKLISLSLRPAPVTSQWLREGPKLGDLQAATKAITLVEAPTPRAEAEAIALGLRQAAAAGKRAALVSPDRMLTRQVTAALDRWDITPDDSAGVPLALSAPGRFLRHVATLFCEPLTIEGLLTLLKHPLCHSGPDERGDHLRLTRELELHVRRYGPPFPTKADLMAWAAKNPEREGWATWVADLTCRGLISQKSPLADHLSRQIDTAERLCAGPEHPGSGGLWAEAAGRVAQALCTDLAAAAPAGVVLTAVDYASLFGAILSEGVVRDRDAGHPNILIWGTLEARVESADLTILGGLNDGVWPESPAPDPWLNRKLRAEAGLLLPDRQIGLSAHDYQQAIAGSEVWITRSKRTADAETVPSRWINRLTNLLAGLPDHGGKAALAQMRGRGNVVLEQVAGITNPHDTVEPEARPAPCPPVTARPDHLSVTQIKTLIRDPYAIYARHVLRLKPLDPLSPSADAPLRGTILHKILQRLIDENAPTDSPDTLIQIARDTFDDMCPWPTIREQWIARFEQIAVPFLRDETARQQAVRQHHTEATGKITVADTGFTLTGRADRIDIGEDGRAVLYDYKSGAVPSAPVQVHFDKQLLVQAAMIEQGGFAALGALPIEKALFLGLGPDLKQSPAPLSDHPADVVWADLIKLIRNWQVSDRGYTARMAHLKKDDSGDYDHLSRFREWEDHDTPVPVILT